MNTHTPLPSTTAFALSLLLHAVVLWKLPPVSLSLPTVGLEPIEVRLMNSPATRRRAAPPSAAPPASRESPAPTSSTPPAADTVGPAENQSDQVQVEARFDAAELDNPQPVYPLAARRLGLQGGVLLTAHIRADGSCAEVRLARSSGHRLLDTAAATAVRLWRFQPARRGDTPVDSWVNIPITFRLQEHG